MQFGAKILPFQGCVGLHFQVCTSPGLCVPVGIYLSPGVSRAGGSASRGEFPPLKAFQLRGREMQQDVLGCCTGVCVTVWLVSAGNCKIFPVQGAGSFALSVHVDCCVFKWGEGLGGT